MSTAVYPGSFDPFTLGHLDILKHACSMFDVVYVGVLVNNKKSCAFTLDERREMIERVIRAEGLANARVDAFDGLLVDYMKRVCATYILRGLRNASDYLYEAEIAEINKRLMPASQTVYLQANPDLAFISSGMVRELSSFGGAVDGLVPESIKQIIAERLTQR